TPRGNSNIPSPAASPPAPSATSTTSRPSTSSSPTTRTGGVVSKGCIVALSVVGGGILVGVAIVILCLCWQIQMRRRAAEELQIQQEQRQGPKEQEDQRQLFPRIPSFGFEDLQPERTQLGSSGDHDSTSPKTTYYSMQRAGRSSFVDATTATTAAMKSRHQDLQTKTVLNENARRSIFEDEHNQIFEEIAASLNVHVAGRKTTASRVLEEHEDAETSATSRVLEEHEDVETSAMSRVLEEHEEEQALLLHASSRNTEIDSTNLLVPGGVRVIGI
ncbi:unnamed protein product, partial [Amoebophrya sp. A25]